jgi:hypothetical protein
VAVGATGATLAWPQNSSSPAPTLTMGTSYTLSYQATAPMTAAVDAKVGHTASPYTADFDTSPGSDSLTSSLQTFTHTFTAAQDDSSTGLAFAITSSSSQSVCFANVSLVQN